MALKLFDSQTKTVASAAFLLALSALGSRFLGLLRDRLLAGTFGAGEELDIYFAAFRIPDFLYALLITGGISAVFLPVFSEVFQRSREEGWNFAANVLNVFLAVIIMLCFLFALATPWLIHIIVPGFSSEQKALATSLTRIMFLSPVLFGLASVFSGMLHYFQKFLVYSLAPILYNIGIILGILFLVPPFGLHGLAYGVLLGAFFYLLIQIPAIMHSGWRYRFIFQPNQQELRKIFRLMAPRILGTSAYQLNLLFITALASTLGIGAIAVFNFSNNLQSLPIGLVGVSFALAAFPALSQSWAEKNKKRFLEFFSSSVRYVLFLVIPMSILMFLLRAQIVRLVLGTGQFGWLETRLTAASLGVFSIGVFAASLVPLVARAFFSLQDTKTPALIGVATFALNVFFSILFVWLLSFPNIFSLALAHVLDIPDISGIGVVALPFAISLSTILQFCILFFVLGIKMGNSHLHEIVSAAKKMIVAGIFLGLSTYSALRLTALVLDLQTFFGVFLQFIIAASAGIFTYTIAAIFFRMQEFRILWHSLMPRQIAEKAIVGEETQLT